MIILSEIEGLNPKYWYADEKGDIQKFVYCKLCHAGPYKITENKDKFIFFGMGNKDAYCVGCSSAHHHFQTSFIPKKKSSQQQEKIERLPLNNSPFKEEPLTMVDLD